MRNAHALGGAAVLVAVLAVGCAQRPAARLEARQAKGSDLPASKTVDLGGGVKMDFALIPAGEFVMGSPATEAGRDGDEGPRSAVRIAKPFYLGKYEVTQEQWQAVMGNSPSRFKGGRKPVEQVTWKDCQDFLRKANALGQGTFRLPTEAEWEYACRAGTTTRFNFGDNDADLHKHGNYCEKSCALEQSWRDPNHDDGHDGTAPVGRFPPNTWGLHDMHGNVWEWCQSLHAAYPYRADDGREDLQPAGWRVTRGGSWRADPKRCRSANREEMAPGLYKCCLGLRVVAE